MVLEKMGKLVLLMIRDVITGWVMFIIYYHKKEWKEIRKGDFFRIECMKKKEYYFFAQGILSVFRWQKEF